MGKIFPLLISQVIVIWKEGLGPAPPGNFTALRNNYHDTEENLGLLCLRKLVGPFGGGKLLDGYIRLQEKITQTDGPPHGKLHSLIFLGQVSTSVMTRSMTMFF